MPLNPGDVLAGKYRIERMLGRGGMGAVYLAENTALGRRVAIKVLLASREGDPEMAARFRGEARAAAAIGHPGIVDVLDLGTTEEGTDFIVMEYLEGESLRELLDRSRPIVVAEVVRIGGELLDALAAAHDAGVIHRDLKPENIFLVARPVAITKILDFGISKRTGAEDASLTTTGQIMGTPHYMSPEQGRGARVGAPTDVYSAGAVLYRVLGGEPPVTGDSINEVITNLATKPPAPLAQLCPHVPRALTTAVDKMLARLPDARPTARAAAAALRSAGTGVGGLDVGAETAPRAEDAPRVGLESTLGATASELGLAPTDAAASSPRAGTRVFLAIAVALLAVAVVVSAFVLVRPGSRSPSSAAPAASARDGASSSDVGAAMPDAAAPVAVDAAVGALAPVDAAAEAPPPTDAAPRRPRRADAGAAAPNLEDVKNQSPFRRTTP